MKLKGIILISITLQISCCWSSELRKKPKVYNALITTDENLVSSRAYPVIQPTIHEPGLPHYSPFSPYGYVTNPIVRFGRPIVPGLPPKEQLPYPLPNFYYPPQVMKKPLDIEPQEYEPQSPPEEEIKSRDPEDSSKPDENEIENNENKPGRKPQSPYPQYPYPPALYPFNQQPIRNIPPSYHLPPYGYNLFPIMYDPINGYRQDFLPPYDYMAKPNLSMRPVKNDKQLPEFDQSNIPTENENEYPNEPQQNSQLPPNFDQIKNNSKSRDSAAVPDVPPPPIPNGAKNIKSSESNNR